MIDTNIFYSKYGCRTYGARKYSDAEITLFSVLFPILADTYKLKFYDTSGIKQGEIGNDIQNVKLLDCNFESLPEGCGSFSFSLSEIPESFTIGYRTRVDIHLFNDTDPWYSGYVMKIPQGADTEIKKTFTGYGFFNQLDTCIIDVTYSNMEISEIADDIIQSYVESETDIVYDSNLFDNTGYTVNEIKFDKVTAKQALTQLMEMADGYVMGVNEDRKFFFQAVDTDVNPAAIKSVGKHMDAFKYEQDCSKILNKIFVFGGKMEEGSNYLATCEDATSQATYGVRAGKMTIPSSLDVTDATRWGNYQLSARKDPIYKGKLTAIKLTADILKAEGKARIFDISGNKIELQIKKVSYSISSQGIKCDMEVGEEYPGITSSIVNLTKNLSNEVDLQQQNISQLAEEGTWTPDLQFGGAKVGISYSVQSGEYRKVGDVVFVSFRIVLTSKGSSSGVAQIHGLPYAVGSSPKYGACNILYYNNMSVAAVHCHRFEAGGSYISLGWQVNSSFNQVVINSMTETEFANNSEIIASGFYFV